MSDALFRLDELTANGDNVFDRSESPELGDRIIPAGREIAACGLLNANESFKAVRWAASAAITSADLEDGPRARQNFQHRELTAIQEFRDVFTGGIVRLEVQEQGHL